MNAFNRITGGAVLTLVLAAGLATPAWAQKINANSQVSAAVDSSGIDFGNDSGDWAKDGECDDPRFEGKGVAVELVDADIGKDATDCRAAFEAGTITLIDAAGAAATADVAATSTGVDFGDDSSEWAKDGECDDPRFEGTGAATERVEADRLKDATDCRAAFEAGTVTLVGSGSTPTVAPPATATEIDFGDDSSEWAKDGECDDPRFEGTGSATELVDADRLKDATDCRAAYEAGTVTLKDGSDTPATATGTSAGTDAIDYGDDTSEWANDGECDDPRFSGTGAAYELQDIDIGRDATDCRAAVEAGTVTFNGDKGSATPVISGDIDYGTDSSEWAKDGECDDPRFSGSGVASDPLQSDIGADATDCRAAVAAGTATFNGGEAKAPIAAFDYGQDWSKWANDGECDDPRFEGAGTNKKLLSDDLYGDATDCRTLVEAGTVSIRTVYTPEYAAGAPYNSDHIDFGDNSSDYADDDVCDDPRFEGPGAASYMLDDDLKSDSVDCKAAFEDGTIMLIDASTAK
ncbi:hypothetical protein [Devosia sp. 2618]|uniref:hypothetical protein n=1 Tax=Devosia sp. 2618 TaxID=3156454 RepID=UPI003399C864